MTFGPTGTLADIVPSGRSEFVKLLELAEDLGMRPRIRSAGRTCADQAALAAQGARTTRAHGCRSWHVLGRALDLDLDPPDCATYTELGEAWEAMGGVWGGRWTSFGSCGDAGHFHLPLEPGQDAVPFSICPEDADCEAVREAYLQSEEKRPVVMTLLGWGAIALGAYLLWKSARAMSDFAP